MKKEAKAAWDHWFLTRRKLRKAPQEATQEKAQAPGAGKKRKKVVKIKLRKEYVDHMAACPFTICAAQTSLTRSLASVPQTSAKSTLLGGFSRPRIVSTGMPLSLSRKNSALC